MTWKPNEPTLRLQQIKAGKYRQKDKQEAGNGAKKADLDKKEEEPSKKATPPKKPLKASRKPIKKRSRKQKDIMKALASAYAAYLKQHPYCVILSPICTKKATCVNHQAGRGINVVLDPKTWEPSCQECNAYIEEHDAWARENGHKISRLGKIKK